MMQEEYRILRARPWIHTNAPHCKMPRGMEPNRAFGVRIETPEIPAFSERPHDLRRPSMIRPLGMQVPR